MDFNHPIEDFEYYESLSCSYHYLILNKKGEEMGSFAMIPRPNFKVMVNGKIAYRWMMVGQSGMQIKGRLMKYYCYHTDRDAITQEMTDLLRKRIHMPFSLLIV